MLTTQLFALKTPRIVSWEDNIFTHFLEALDQENFSLQENDIIAITSKIYSMKQQTNAILSEVIPSSQANHLGKEASLDPRVAQLVLDESNGEVFGTVFHAILAKTPYGLSANAGIDLSNCPKGYALLLPKNPDQEAVEFRNAIREKFNIDVAVIMIDSRTIPLRKGTNAVALGIAGMDPIIDERGKPDLYGRKMLITTRAIADNAATAINMIMGETNERTPFGVVRGIEYPKSNDATIAQTLMPEKECIYFAPFLKLIG